MQRGAIAPVDLAQSAIGPGIAVFSRFSKVVEADGRRCRYVGRCRSSMRCSMRVISEEETEFDADTRWAVTWYRQFGLNPGPYGSAETLSKAKNTSVAGVIEAGFAAGGTVAVAAQVAGVHRGTIYRWLRRGETGSHCHRSGARPRRVHRRRPARYRPHRRHDGDLEDDQDRARRRDRLASVAVYRLYRQRKRGGSCYRVRVAWRNRPDRPR